MRHARFALISLATCLALALPGAAHAEEELKAEGSQRRSGDSTFRRQGALLDASPQDRRQMLSFFAFLPWQYGFGVGGAVRYGLPIVPEGFIPALNDSFELEFGADIWTASYFALNYGYVGLAAPIAEARWTFHLTDKFAAYGKVSTGWSFSFDSYTGNGRLWGGGFYYNVGPGLLYRIGDRMVLRAEAGNLGLRGGIGIEL